jgi:cytochrome c5
MSKDHPDAIESNIETHPVKLAVMVAVGSVALVVGLIMLAYFALGVYGGAITGSERANLAPEAVKQRLAPVGFLQVDETKKPAATPNAAATPAPAAPMVAAIIPAAIPAAPVAGAGAKTDGKATYDLACTACHTGGIAGAPKTGDKVAWADRIKQGNGTLYDHAIKGYQGKAGVMPAKGGNTSLSDDAVKAAVDYMVTASR